MTNSKKIFQTELLTNLENEFPSFTVLVMHNEQKRSAFATQVEDLTNNVLTYGDFKHECNYLINTDEKTIIILTEDSIQKKALFSLIANTFKFDEPLDYIIKKSLCDIDYMVRDNNCLGDIMFLNELYTLFRKAPDCQGDLGKIFIVKK